MTLWVMPGEVRRVVKWLLAVDPVGVPRVELCGSWYDLEYDRAGRVGALLVCGPGVDPPTPGCVRVTGDCLPVVDVDGEWFTDGWVRVRR